MRAVLSVLVSQAVLVTSTWTHQDKKARTAREGIAIRPTISVDLLEADEELAHLVSEESPSFLIKPTGSFLSNLLAPGRESSFVRCSSVTLPGKLVDEDGQMRKSRSISVETVGLPPLISPRNLRESPHRSSSPVVPSYYRKYQPSDSESPIQVISKMMNWCSMSPRADSNGSSLPLLKAAEAAITPELIEQILSFQLLPYQDEVHGESLRRLYKVSSLLSLQPPAEKNPQLTSFRTSDKIVVFSRAIAELLVDVVNSRGVTSLTLQKAAPYVHAFARLASSIELQLPFMDRYRSTLDQILKLPPMYTRCTSHSAPVAVTPLDSEKIAIALSHIESSLDSLSEGIRESDPIFASIQLVAKHLLITPNEIFCSKYAEDILILLYNGWDESLGQVSPAVTRTVVDLVHACKLSITFELKFQAAFPRLLQSAVNSVPLYRDGDVVLAIRQGPELVSSVLESLSSFTKLELMNEVYAEFIGSDGKGIDGLRREWISKTSETMANPEFGLFEFTDERMQFIRPIVGANLSHLRAFGRVLGLALRYGITPGVFLAPGCMRALLNRSAPWRVEELSTLLRAQDPRQNASLDLLLHMSDEQLAPLALEMVSGRSVDSKNVAGYVSEKKTQLVHFSILGQMTAITAGITDTVRQAVFDSLEIGELTALITGPLTVDIRTLRRQVSWGPLTAQVPRQVIWLLEILESFSELEKRKFLAFVSAASRPPIGGFQSKDPARRWLHVFVNKHLATDLLPTAQTCEIQIILPPYESLDDLRTKLLIAIDLGVSIDLV